MQVGPLRPVAWFKFHTRAEARSWKPEPVTVWEGQDPDLAHSSNAGSQPSASTAPENTPDEAGPSGTYLQRTHILLMGAISSLLLPNEIIG